MSKFSRFTTSTKHEDLSSDEFAVAILSSHYNYRLKHMGAKCLIPVNGRPAIEHQINTIRSVYPRSEIYVVVGFEGDKVIKAVPPNIRIIENQLDEVNEVGELRLFLNNCPAGKVLLINGDVIFNKESIIGLFQNQSTLLVDSQDQMPATEIGVTVSEGKATVLNFTIKDKKFCNVAFLTGKELKLFRDICQNRSLSTHYFFEAINILLDKTGGIYVAEPRNMKISRLVSKKEILSTDENFNL